MTYNVHILAMIKRKQGLLQESLQILQSIPTVSTNYVYLKQIAITLFLLKRYRLAIEVYSEHLLKSLRHHCAADWVMSNNNDELFLKLYDIDNLSQPWIVSRAVEGLSESSGMLSTGIGTTAK